MQTIPDSRGQSGAVLFMALIFLVLLTVMAVTTFTIGKSTSQAVDNMSMRRTALEAASQAGEYAMSTKRIIDDPNNALRDPASGTYGNVLHTDVIGDGTLVVKNTIGNQKCVMAAPKTPAGLDPEDPVDKNCIYSVDKTGSTPSECFNVTFQYRITSREQFNGGNAATGAVNSVTQGLYINATKGAAITNCPTAFL